MCASGQDRGATRETWVLVGVCGPRFWPRTKKGAIRDHGIVLVDPDVVLDQQCREVCCETNIDRSTTNEDRSRSGKRTGASHFYVWRDRNIIALFTASSCQF